MKSFLILLFITLLGILLFFFKYEYNSNKKPVVKTINKKTLLVKCELNNEIINMKNLDSERQCYYDCGKDDIVRVDTSISYPCQNYIMENR
jgi:hypothetical protein